jgi:hypothetical protein
MGRFARDSFLAIVAAFRRDPLDAAWLLLWFPFWVGSVATPPRRSWRHVDPYATSPNGEAGSYLASRLDGLTRRFGMAWMVGSIIRGVVIALAVLSIWSILAAMDVTSLPSIRAGIVVTAILVAIGAIHGWYAWPSRTMVTHMLDRTFWLNERMVTAFERPASDSRLSRIQLADAANTFDDIAPGISRSTYLPIREVILCLLFAGGLLVFLLAGISQRDIVALEAAPVPQFLVASERLTVREQPVDQQPPLSDTPAEQQSSIAEIQERGRTSQETREDLSRLGEALENYPLTQPAADAISNGNYAESAELLRTAADSVESMDQASRNALADDLDQAAQEMSETNPELAQQAQETADALREGGPGASDAVRDLADQVEETGEQVESQESLSQELDEATNNSSGSNQGGEQGSSQESSEGGSGSEQGTGEQGTGSDPGEGVEAQPGVSSQEQPSEGSSSDSESSESSSEESGGSGSSEGGEGESQQSSESNGGDSTGADSSDSSGSDGSSQDLSGAPDDETNASQGSGAGTGQSNANDQSEGGPVDNPNEVEENPDAEVPSEGEAGDPPPSRSDRGEEDDSRGTNTQGESSLQLQGTSDQGVQSGGDSGTSSTGDGGDSSTASGDMVSEDPGIAGPDSNRVPPALRDVVQGYFESPEEP